VHDLSPVRRVDVFLPGIVDLMFTAGDSWIFSFIFLVDAAGSESTVATHGVAPGAVARAGTIRRGDPIRLE